MVEKKRMPVDSPATAESFAQHLREGMDRRGLKQADLIRMASQRGAKLGKSQVSQYVSGKTLPRRAVVQLLSDILEIEPSFLMGRVRPPRARPPIPPGEPRRGLPPPPSPAST